MSSEGLSSRPASSGGGPLPQGVLASVPTQDPRCCGQTSLRIQCRHAAQRAFQLRLPLPVSAKPPAAGRKRPGAYLEVVSDFDSFDGGEELSVSLHGPAQCPPGVRNQALVRHGTIVERVPAGSTVKVPVRARLLPTGNGRDRLKERFLKELAPWKWDDLEIAEVTVEAESCRETDSLKAAVFVYPDLRCRAEGNLDWGLDRRTGRISAGGDGRVVIDYNGGEAVLELAAMRDDLEKHCPLPWGDLMSLVTDLHTAERLAALEGGSRGDPPVLARFSVSGTAALVEKKTTPDVHARYFFQAGADPLLALNYEFNLLPWLEAAIEGGLPEKPLAGLEIRSWPRGLSRLFDEGVFLLARGGIAFAMTFSSSRLAGGADPSVGRASGLISFRVEARSTKPGRANLIEIRAAGEAGEQGEAEAALEVNGECLCGVQPALHQWKGKAGFGGLEIKGVEHRAAKVVLYSGEPLKTPETGPDFPGGASSAFKTAFSAASDALSSKKGCNILIFKSNTWWEPAPFE